MKRFRNKANNYDVRVKNGTYPGKGLMQVISAVKNVSVEYLSWANDLASGKAVFSWTKNNQFCGCLYAAMFSYGVQGRTKAVEQLDLIEFVTCWTNKIPIASTKFKTVRKYGKQIVTIPDGIANDLMTAYFETIRPAARTCLQQQGIALPRRGNYSYNMLLLYPTFCSVDRRETFFVEDWKLFKAFKILTGIFHKAFETETHSDFTAEDGRVRVQARKTEQVNYS